jgi:protein-tyrosine-phosphatase
LKILFVCSGNICRSPMAGAYLAHRATRGGSRTVAVDSAGLLGIEGQSASREAVDRLAGRGSISAGSARRGCAGTTSPTPTSSSR